MCVPLDTGSLEEGRWKIILGFSWKETNKIPPENKQSILHIFICYSELLTNLSSIQAVKTKIAEKYQKIHCVQTLNIATYMYIFIFYQFPFSYRFKSSDSSINTITTEAPTTTCGNSWRCHSYPKIKSSLSSSSCEFKPPQTR